MLGWWYLGSGVDMRGIYEHHMPTETYSVNGRRFAGCNSLPYRLSDSTVIDPCGALHFWSTHGAGSNFAFADGSVHFLRNSAATILPQLATRAGAEVVELP
jgi:prepilin-type processing-associated H-X9-DG protein